MKIVNSLAASLGMAALVVVGTLVGPSSNAAQDGNFGTIKGRLVWGGDQIPKPETIDIKGKDPEVCGTKPHFDRSLEVDPKTKGIKDAFAYVANPKGKNPEAVKTLVAKQSKVEVDQKTCEFIPYSTAMMKDQRIVFKSSDPVGHNVHYTSFAGNDANFALPPKGEAEKKLVKDAFPVTLKCDIHPWMKGWIMVFDHPFFAVTKSDGSFEIQGVPAGTQTLIVRTGDHGFITPNKNKGLTVQVKAGDVTDVGNIVFSPSLIRKTP